MSGSFDEPNALYLSNRSVVRRKYERTMENLAVASGVETIEITTSQQFGVIYRMDGTGWLQAIDAIEELSKRLVDSKR